MVTVIWKWGLLQFTGVLYVDCVEILMDFLAMIMWEEMAHLSGIKSYLRNRGKPPTIYSIARDPIMMQSKCCYSNKIELFN